MKEAFSARARVSMSSPRLEDNHRGRGLTFSTSLSFWMKRLVPITIDGHGEEDTENNVGQEEEEEEEIEHIKVCGLIGGWGVVVDRRERCHRWLVGPFRVCDGDFAKKKTALWKR